MATKYDLPQFKSPTGQYQRMPIVRTPNYGEIYAKNFLAGQQMMANTMNPILNKIKEQSAERKRIEEKGDVHEDKLDATINKMFDTNSSLDEKNREHYSKKADLLNEAYEESLKNPNKKNEDGITYRDKYKSMKTKFTDDLRLSDGVTTNVEAIMKRLGEGNISNWQQNAFLLSLSDEFIENKGQGLKYRITENMEDELYFTDAYGQDVVLGADFLANTDLLSLIPDKGDFSSKGQQGQELKAFADNFKEKNPNISLTDQEILNDGKGHTRRQKKYTKQEKAIISRELLNDDVFQSMYGKNTAGRSLFLHDYNYTAQGGESLAGATEKIMIKLKAQGVEIDDFTEDMVQTMLFKYNVNPEATLSEDEKRYEAAIEEYIDERIVDYYMKENFPQPVTEDKYEKPTVDTNKFKAELNTIHLLDNWEGAYGKINELHKLVTEMGAPPTRGKINQWITNEFGQKPAAESKFDEIGKEDSEGNYPEYQYYIGDDEYMISSKNSLLDTAKVYFELTGANISDYELEKLINDYIAQDKTIGPVEGVEGFNKYLNDLKNSYIKKLKSLGGDESIIPSNRIKASDASWAPYVQ